MVSDKFRFRFFKPRDLLFSLGNDEAKAASLALLSGPLIQDSGEADPLFTFRCQDRYLVYSRLLGLRSLLFVLSEAHERIYGDCLADLNSRLSQVWKFVGLEKPIAVPFPSFVPEGEFVGDETDARWLDHRFEEMRRFKCQRLFANQISPSLVQKIRWLRSRCGLGSTIDVARLDARARLVLSLHDKRYYVNLIEGVDRFSRHIPTAILTIDELKRLRTWEELVACVGGAIPIDEGRSLFVKSNYDSGGNSSMQIERTNFLESIETLRRQFVGRSSLLDERACFREVEEAIDQQPSMRRLQLSEAVKRQAASDWAGTRRAQPLSLLVQPFVERATGTGETESLPNAIGISLMIVDVERIEIIGAFGQVFSDRARSRHLGAWFDRENVEAIEARVPWEELMEVARMIARQGYQGPIGFDGVLNDQGVYEFVFDCNPRMTAILPMLAVANYLERQKIEVRAILNLDYRGRYVVRNLNRTLERLKHLELLFTVYKPRGMLLLPNISRACGYDIVMINWTMAQIRAALDAETLAEAGIETDWRGGELYY